MSGPAPEPGRDPCVAALWPAPVRLAASTGGAPSRAGYLPLPSARAPRLLLPWPHPRAAARAVASTRRFGAAALGAALRCGLADRLLTERLHVLAPDGVATIEEWLAGLLGRELAVAVRLGPPRANRKPVLHLMTPRGATLAFAKLAANALTAELVRAEAAALRTLAAAPLRHTRVPGVLALSEWHGRPLLVLEALPVPGPELTRRPARLRACLAEIAAAQGTHTAPLLGCAYLKDLYRDLDGLAARGPEAAEPAAALRAVLDGLPDVELAFGGWHGDLTRGNLAPHRTGVLVWDWERYRQGVPVGFDALHLRLQDMVSARGRAGPADTTALCASAGRLLRPFGVAPAAAGVVAALYLTEIAVRYLRDRQDDVGAPVAGIGRWLLPPLRRHVRTLRPR
ncbi:phosphotransferase [Allonocardiopsis opalescens]|uniref:Phosphotransferase family enzyme n=1 Tax=Allonocardiopsis opalescens TaxID=1144618 RepID=A0A2T0QD66_9ACTN|nr:phosphotransferase [Allonocardiopsis opalescens]PRY01848.1 phosphotransferase family enzyme [Allonocardiopsis opalescens]